MTESTQISEFKSLTAQIQDRLALIESSHAAMTYALPLRHLQTNAPPAELGLFDLLEVLVDNLRLLLIVPLAGGFLALGLVFLMPPVFTATTKFMPPQQQQQSSTAAMLQSLGALGGLAGAATGLKNPADQYVAFLKSRSIQDAMVDRFKLTDRFETKKREESRKKLGDNSKISAGKDGLISIDVTDTDPVFAAQLANAYVEELGLVLNRLALTETQQRRVFFEKQMVNSKNKLIQAEQALKSSGVSSDVLKVSPGAAVEGLAKLKANITAQEIKIASMRGYLTESTPDFKQAFIELTSMKAQMSRAAKEELPGTGSGDYISKFREFKYHETLFELFSKQYEMARVDESREGAIIQVLDLAVPPESKSGPKKGWTALLAMLATGFAMLLFVLFRQALKGLARAPDSQARMERLHAGWLKALGRP